MEEYSKDRRYPLSTLKLLVDPYMRQKRCEKKHGFIIWHAKLVLFVSNHPPPKWYEDVMSLHDINDPEAVAFLRRFPPKYCFHFSRAPVAAVQGVPYVGGNNMVGVWEPGMWSPISPDELGWDTETDDWVIDAGDAYGEEVIDMREV
jgi:hypothetical protein